MNDALGDRMKRFEAVTRAKLPPRTYTIIRLDGRAFHTYTRPLRRPYCEALHLTMCETARLLCLQLSGAQLAYIQSDEISILLTDFAKTTTQPWFDGSIQKMVSVAASICTAEFNEQARAQEALPHSRATFDARAFTIPDPVEVANYLIWRWQDARRNSISMAAQARFSHNELLGKSSTEMIQLLDDAQHPWDAEPEWFKNGSIITKAIELKPVRYLDKRTNEWVETPPVERSVWQVEPCPRLTQEAGRDLLALLIPRLPAYHDAEVLQRAR